MFLWFFLQHQNFLTVFFVCFFTQGLIDQASVNTCTDPDGGTLCNAHIADAATCTSTPRIDGNSATCVFATAPTGNTCTSAGNAGTACDAHNADESTCTTEPRTDAGTTCVFVAPTSPRVPVPNPCSGNPCTATNDATTCCKPSALCSSMTTANIVEVCKGELQSNNIFDQTLLTCLHVYICVRTTQCFHSFLLIFFIYFLSSYKVSWGLIPMAKASTTFCEGVICGPVDAQCWYVDGILLLTAYFFLYIHDLHDLCVSLIFSFSSTFQYLPSTVQFRVRCCPSNVVCEQWWKCKFICDAYIV